MNYNTSNNNLYYIKKQVKDLTFGDIILHPIYRTDGLMLVNKEKELSVSLISMIKKHIPSSAPVLIASSRDALQNFRLYNNSQTDDFIHDSMQISKDLNLSNEIQSDFINNVQKELNGSLLNENSAEEQTQIEFNFFTTMLYNYPLWISLDSKLESERLKIRARQVKHQLLTSMNTDMTFDKLFNRIKEYDDVLLIHSINTMCISLIIGLTMELNRNELFDLAVAALFSNVGFVEIEKKDFQSFLKAPEHINEQLKRHLEAFSDITQSFPQLRKKEIVFGILDHHEFYNGQGFPNGKVGEDISLYGRILSIAHNYDELVGGYNFQVGLHPMEALRIIYDNNENKYDQHILNIFIYRTTYFKLGETISMPSIHKGVIIGFDNYIKAPHLPIVQLENEKIINLAKINDIDILQ